jgi:hypothetical protein
VSLLVVLKEPFISRLARELVLLSMVAVVDGRAEGLEMMEAGDVTGPSKDGRDPGGGVDKTISNVGEGEGGEPWPSTGEKTDVDGDGSDVVEEGEVNPFTASVLDVGVRRRVGVGDACRDEERGKRVSDKSPLR